MIYYFVYSILNIILIQRVLGKTLSSKITTFWNEIKTLVLQEHRIVNIFHISRIDDFHLFLHCVLESMFWYVADLFCEPCWEKLKFSYIMFDYFFCWNGLPSFLLRNLVSWMRGLDHFQYVSLRAFALRIALYHIVA